MKIPDKLYDILKWICLICLPALVTFLMILLPAVGVSAETTQVVATVITGFAAFIGALIGISTNAYKIEQKTE